MSKFGFVFFPGVVGILLLSHIGGIVYAVDELLFCIYLIIDEEG